MQGKQSRMPCCKPNPCKCSCSEECTCDEIVLVDAQWDSQLCQAIATFSLPSQCKRKAWLHACAQVRPQPGKCMQKERETEVCLDCEGTFQICIPKGTLALCLRLKIKPKKCDNDYDDCSEYCAVFSKLNGPCAFLSIAATPTATDAPTVQPAPLGPVPAGNDQQGMAWKVGDASGQLLEWTDAELLVDPTLIAGYAFFANAIAPANALLRWKASVPGSFNIFSSTPAIAILSDVFPEDALVTFTPLKANLTNYLFSETFQFNVTAELVNATTLAVLCTQSVTIKNNAQTDVIA